MGNRDMEYSGNAKPSTHLEAQTSNASANAEMVEDAVVMLTEEDVRLAWVLPNKKRGWLIHLPRMRGFG
jgi:hypothetical protein